MNIKHVATKFQYTMSDYIRKKWGPDDWEYFHDELVSKGRAEGICGPDINGDWVIYFPADIEPDRAKEIIEKCVRNVGRKPIP